MTISLCLQPLTVVGSRAAENASTPEITLRIYNYSWATPSDLSSMESAATQILGRSGISLRWIQCSPVLEETGPSSPCGSPLARTSFQVLVTTDPKGLRRDALGSSRQGIPIISISYQNSKHLAVVHDLPVGRVLGHAVAHEIGHLLLGSEHHAVSGIMKARFGPEDLYDMERAWLVFTPEQSRLLRKTVTAK